MRSENSLLRSEPPYSETSEAAVIGGLLLSNEGLQHVAGLEADAFYVPAYREVWKVIQEQASAGMPFDTVTVRAELESRGIALDLGFLRDMSGFVPSAKNFRSYVSFIKDQHLLRQLMAAGTEIYDLGMTMGETGVQQVDKAQMLLAKLATFKGQRDPKHVSQSMVEYLDLLQDMSEGKNPAIQTGIGGLDKLLNGGLRRGEVMVIGARPKHGKTALALAIARNIARHHNVLYLSQEMPTSQLMHRHTAAAGSFDIGRILAADPDDHDMWTTVTDAARRVSVLKLSHDDQSGLNLMDIRRKAMKVRREHGLDVIFVDFLQLMSGAGEESRNRELDVIVNGIKVMAMDLGIAAVVLSQMSRKADEHYSRPLMGHLRDSGAIEAAADQVALLFTDWAHPMSKRTEAFEGYSELEIVAHRNGPQGVVPLQFIGKYQQMGDWMGPMPLHKAAPASLRSRSADF
ncbi:replicative DNA helicase [Ottowia thiooxydans]|uniref:replicative DNA helicase n=1 Tax=Ottowia thiooxydans TaxID=219182 RepID=UPI000415069F|nr:DnaB-like helicase C-terminal domain-containing protein [Ottowia thiooxydans]